MKKAFLILGLVAVSAAAGGLTAWTVSADRGGSVAYIEREVERTPALGTQFTSYQAEQYPDLTEAERMELMYELNGDYLTTSAPIWTSSSPVPFSLSGIWSFGTAAAWDIRRF